MRTFPNTADYQYGTVVGRTVLDDGDTFSGVEGSVLALILDDRCDLDDVDDAKDFVEDEGVFLLQIDALPYMTDTLFLFLGIDAKGKSAAELLVELRKCSASNNAEMQAISALRLAIEPNVM